ncbi:TOMM precursor leader peptide-binding protein [Nonomuraea longicatena]|uniref:TOMM leader peptide-binding protein n=1 Tax=Nonomuraea longicatena TaxID=83682 RepID=A0ABP4BDL6_9ACTN
MEVVAGEGVFLVSEHGLHILTGRSAEAVAGLLDGEHTVPDILASVDLPPEEVYYLLHRLKESCLLVETGDGLDRSTAAYWDLAGPQAETAVAGIASGRVHVRALGRTTAADLSDLLTAEGIDVVTDPPASGEGGGPAVGRLDVVLTDDYLRPELAEINLRHLAEGRPWLLARPVGPVLWLGPFFGTGPCWRCLAHRLEGHRQPLAYLEGRAGGPLAVPLAELPLTRETGVRLVAAEVLKWLAGVRDRPHVTTFDTQRLETVRHELRRRPQCPACGDVRLMAEAARRPVEPVSRAKTSTADGGHRAGRPEDVAERYGHLVSPITGVVRELVRADAGTSFARTYVAGHNVARRARDLGVVRKGLRSQSAGKGMTDAQARVSAMCEAIERYSGVFQGDEARHAASLADLGADAVHPNACALYSDRQYRTRHTARDHVPEPLDPDAVIDWTPVWSLTERRHKYLPTGYLYYAYDAGPMRAWADSNGNAAGASLEDAIVQGFLELVERDAVALWWYNRVRRPAFDLDALADRWIDEFQEVYAGMGRGLHVLDLTADLGVPVAAAISYRAEGLLMAFGAHFDVRLAVQRALAELNQFLPALADPAHLVPDGWWKDARLEEHPHLVPVGEPVAPSAYDRPFTADLLDDIVHARELVEARGMELLVLDQTRPDLGMPVVKVIVPGMRHFWRRLAPGRLYDVPVALGWLAEPTPEEEMNPVTMFL